MTDVRVCLFIFVYSIALTKGQYEVPEATVEVFKPKGLRVSIPDEEGIRLFAFHGKINEEINVQEAGTFSQDITKAKGGRWTFFDPQARLSVGDTLNYWTFVDYFDGERTVGYVKDDQSFIVTELLPKPNGNSGNKGNNGKGQGHGNNGKGQGHGNGNKDKTTHQPIDKTTHQPIDKTTQQPILTRPPDVCVPSVTTVKGKSSCKGHLIFDSQFDRFLEDKEKFWTVERKFASAPDYEFVVYEDNPKTLSVYNGNLVITPILTDEIYGDGYVTQSMGLDLGEHCTGIKGSPECSQKPEGWYIIPPTVSSKISTKGKFSFRYGKVEIRAKLPKGDWIYPELFLSSENEEYGPNYESGQIRIAFASGNTDRHNILESGVILGQKPAARKYAVKTLEKNSPWSDDFHTFTVLWTPDSITLSVDNSVYGTIFPPEGGFSSLASNLQLKNSERWKTGTKLAPFDKEMNIVIGVGVGGHNFEDRTDGSKPWFNNQKISQKDFYKARTSWLPSWGENAKLDVDYVKVWALDS